MECKHGTDPLVECRYCKEESMQRLMEYAPHQARAEIDRLTAKLDEARAEVERLGQMVRDRMDDLEAKNKELSYLKKNELPLIQELEAENKRLAGNYMTLLHESEAEVAPFRAYAIELKAEVERLRAALGKIANHPYRGLGEVYTGTLIMTAKQALEGP